MSELLPPREARALQNRLEEYLTTTFALADGDAQTALKAFLSDPTDGLFKGPYIRTSLPFQPAPRRSVEGLSWVPDKFTPYGHQAAAFARLNSAHRRPLPTLITTGTGSGKTEAFTYPVLDHAARARRAGQRGVKALFLYPMNALATDQASRLASTICAPGDRAAENPWAGVTAAIYTGDQTHQRTTMSAEGIITSREAIRSDPPDILLTNYKMLDQLLLRPADQRIWAESADSLQYLVLDEFHTYDGAQGTDVAMLLRRLGLTLKSYWSPPGDTPQDHDTQQGQRDLSPSVHTAEEWARPLGRITPVGTSATLGGGSETGRQQMVDFATTIFGEPFDTDCVVTESRKAIDEWAHGVGSRAKKVTLRPMTITTSGARQIHDAAERAGGDAAAICQAVLKGMYEPEDPHASSGDSGSEVPDASTDRAGSHDHVHDRLLALAAAHPFIRSLVTRTTEATHIDRLADDKELFPGEGTDTDSHDHRVLFLLDLVSALAHLRAQPDRDAISTETHLWIRELSRIDREASTEVRYHWSDDGVPAGAGDDFTAASLAWFPAVYCRHCGRSGWGVQLANTGADLTANDDHIRTGHASHSNRFRALISATREAEQEEAESGGQHDSRLMWFDTLARHFSSRRPEADDPAYRNGSVIPVLMLTGEDADDQSRDDRCPSCQQRDGIRFLGSAIATLLSVTMSNLFGSPTINPGEKKALVFADSVQDAAHHAGFISARSHSITLRAVLRNGLGDEQLNLNELTDRVLELARDDVFKRYRILPVELASNPENAEFWTSSSWSGIHSGLRNRVRRRLLFDAIMEFALSSHFGRTLERTGSAWAHVGTESGTELGAIAQQVLADLNQDRMDEPLADLSQQVRVRWVRGVLERMRSQGAIDHEWFDRFIDHDGQRYFLWGGRTPTQRTGGMPAFPTGRAAPGFPYTGGGRTPRARRDRRSDTMLLDPVTGSQSWYADWTRRVLGVPPRLGGVLAKDLLVRLAAAGVIASVRTGTGDHTVYKIRADHVIVGAADAQDVATGRILLRCDVCRTPYPGSPDTVADLRDGPCLSSRCPGHLRPEAGDPDNAYRHLYESSDMRRVVSREHTSLLSNQTRAEYEEAFKRGSTDPAAPNVLVATPTLEMGIDIGDLSAVFLAGLPRRVANYLQRVGRAGRLTGNSLDMAYVRGRGEFLPRLGEPESLINGEVQPPATYLSAEEILKRQYLAHIADGMARDDIEKHHPRSIGEAMNSQPGEYLGDLISAAEQPGRLAAFLATFDGRVDEAARETLTAWADPGSAPGSSDLAALVHGAAQSWHHEQEALRYRKDQIMSVLEELDQRATVTQASDDVDQLQAATAELALVEGQLDRADERTDDTAERRAEQRTATSALRQVNREIAETGTEYWISTLERVGLFPNYTLLDDSVTLDVAMSWFNPDSGAYEHEPVSYQRGSAIALRDFAPGSTFYAHGYAVRIDSVDLGPDGQEIRNWVFCPQCGYGKDLTESGVEETITECPRCGTPGIGDSGNRMEVVEFKKASANVNRDSCRITDSSDERVNANYTMVLTADVDEARIAHQWFVEGSEFGAKLVNGMTLRWLNLGKRQEQGSERMIAGDSYIAPLFRVCEGCGHLDTQSRANSRAEHAPWCQYRDAPEEHNRAIALSRTLTTQGVLLPLPWSITTGDSFAIPSLAAAVLMGLRSEFGGSPDHIGVEVVSDPTAPGETPQQSLLLHDQVPGGTGYLAKLANPRDVWQMLYSAWRRVHDCECQAEGRLACHRCLLPYASPQAVPHISRMAAERHLRVLLTGSVDGPEPTEEMAWKRADAAVATDPSDESALEQRFRVEARAGLEGVAMVHEVPGPTGNVMTVSAGNRQFRIQPQVDVLGARPDFRLFGSGIPQVEIFTDGLRYHATREHNRVADDAQKRAALRLGGDQVLAITMADCEQEAARRASGGSRVAPPAWLNEQITGPLRTQFGFSQDAADALTSGPFAFLDYVVSGGSQADLRRFSNAVPAYFMITGGNSGARRVYLDEAMPLPEMAAGLICGQPAVPSQTSGGFWWHRGEVGVLVDAQNVMNMRICVVLDDRTASVGSETFADSWRLWLQISNALIARTPDDTDVVTVESVRTSRSAAAAPSSQAGALAAAGSSELSGGPVLTGGGTPSRARADFMVPDPAIPVELVGQWQAVLGNVDKSVAPLVRQLADAGVSVPESGEEVAGIPTDLSWPSEKIVVVVEPEEGDAEELQHEGWRLVPAEVKAIVKAVRGTDG
ncbi:ATP-dependent helicase [Acidipropionibacterium jensenii]|uniref:ATP-dependent helicase n=1 Tax=Acidipropionibacterium jensenii TaxID=1749 RepID=A0A3S4W8C7_9ACTN|nr:DEAD/DEAH box helicase [Acidipropionibacterium jensenii]VEI03183.1 ATP-dependent helicase [Acidipropionibacterium jensenii]